MRNAHKQFAEGHSALRFGVIQGNRTGKQAQEAKPLVALPSVNRRHRGLHLVSGAQKEASIEPVVRSFDQARQIVAQVEWEIEQQAAFERRKNTRHWQPLSFVLAGARMPLRSADTSSGMTRLRRFFGF